jgi:aryl-alcohol dehydrogenase-like predicted oxidoreductase
MGLWATPRTSVATLAAGFCRKWRPRSAVCAPIGSISTRSIARLPDTDIEETLSALDDLVSQGKVRYIGSSTFPALQIAEAQWLSRGRLARFICEQPPYSLLVRSIEADVLPTCLRHGMGGNSLESVGGRLAFREMAERRFVLFPPQCWPAATVRPLHPHNQRKL